MIITNYILEANLGLGIFALAYYLLLKNETDFRFKRVSILVGVFASLVFPFFHLSFDPVTLPSLGKIIPTVLLPEVNVGANASSGFYFPFDIKSSIASLYAFGVVVLLLRFAFDLYRLLILIKSAKTVRYGRYSLVESTENISPFSFFHFIFIGNSDKLTKKEKEQIIAHERVHADQYHSVDMLLLNVLKIVFWFNPIIGYYKNIFVQLHEFEADARSVKNNEVNEYCNLLARVALLSADLRIANHFSNSLTLKRIQMMRKIKMKIQGWKVGILCLIVPAFFVFVACQDQALTEVSEIAKTSTMALDVPANVQERYDALTKQNPQNKYILIEVSESKKLDDVEKQYGLPSSVEVFKSEETPVKGSSETGVIIKRGEKVTNEARSFVILEYNSKTKNISELSQSSDNVYSIVDETAVPSAGMTDYYKFISENLSYPLNAKTKGTEGKVFVEFIVETDGTLSDVKVMKGVSPELDAEALRVVKLSPRWVPGKQDGVSVRQKMVLPINFSL